MELNTISLTDFVRNATILFMKGVDTVPLVARGSGLFRVEPVPQNTGNTREYTEIDLELYAKAKNQSDQASRAKVQQGYSKVARLKRIALDIGISYEMRTQNKYTEVVAKLTNLGMLGARRIELDLTHRLTFAHSRGRWQGRENDPRAAENFLRCGAWQQPGVRERADSGLLSARCY